MKKVLMVDDDLMSFELLEIYLKRLNITDVITARNGKDAVDLFIKNKDDIDLVFMDILMPYMTGYDAIDEILKIKKVPIIVVSALSMIGDAEKSISHGCLEHISKPVNFDYFENILKKHNLI